MQNRAPVGLDRQRRVLLLAIGRLFRSCQSFLGQALLHLLPKYLVLQRVLLFPGSFDLDCLRHMLLFINVLFTDRKVFALGVARGGAAGGAAGGVRGGGGSSGSGLGNYESKVFGCYP